jgi:hypothetical protein
MEQENQRTLSWILAERRATKTDGDLGGPSSSLERGEVEGTGVTRKEGIRISFKQTQTGEERCLCQIPEEQR